MLTMVFYWVLFGVTVAAFLLIMYGIAVLAQKLADSLKELDKHIQ